MSATSALSSSEPCLAGRQVKSAEVVQHDKGTTTNENMKILGIDPGIEITGFGIIESGGGVERLLHCGVIRTPRTLSMPERLMVLHDDLSSLLRQHHDITACGVEELFFAKNAKTAFVVGQARGVILFTLQRAGVTIVEIKPTHAKSIVVGSGNADKKEMQKMIMLRFHLATPPQPDDAADAVAVAIATAGIAREQKFLILV